MSQKYIHCSWDTLEPGSPIPRVPKSRVIGPNISEDDSTPRICVADTVQRALMAMPGTGKIIKIMQKDTKKMWESDLKNKEADHGNND